MAETKIVTGQYVSLDLPLASIGSRILAQLIDQLVILSIMGTISIIIVSVLSKLPGDFGGTDTLIAIYVIACFIIPSGYFIVQEYLMGGQTIGKMALKIKVTTLDGTKPTLGSLIVRWVLFPVDTFLTSFLGMIFIIFSEKHQRIGDFAAGTTVVTLKGFDRSLLHISDFEKVPNNYTPTYPEAANLNMKQAEVIRTALYYNENKREYYIDLAAQKVQEYLKTDINPLISNEQYLNIIFQDYKYYAAGGV